MNELSEYVRILGRGPGRARNLTEAEAYEAMSLILSETAAPEAVGALLMLMRYRGEDAPEIAGFTRAVRAVCSPWLGPAPAVDWPSYAAGRTRGLPLFLLSARLVALAGRPVLMHGWNSHQGTGADVRAALNAAGIRSTDRLDEAATVLAEDGLAYVPVEAFAPGLHRLLKLRDVLGLRSCLNTVARMVNPGGAALSVQGVFHPSYRALQRDAGVLLGQAGSLSIKGGGGEFERHPGKAIEAIGQTGEEVWTVTHPAKTADAVRLADGCTLPLDAQSLADLWSGRVSDAFAEACVVGTAALIIGSETAQRIWDNRLTQRAVA